MIQRYCCWKRKEERVLLVWITVLLLGFLCAEVCYAQNSESYNTELGSEEGVQEEKDDEAGNLLEELELSQVQEMLDEMLTEQSFSIKDMIKKVIQGEEIISKETVQKGLYSLFFGELQKEKTLFAKVILLILTASVFANFAAVFDSGQIGEICFYVVYLLLFVLLMDSFMQVSETLEQTFLWMNEFSRGLAPAFFFTVSVSSGATSAAIFYEGILMLTWMIQWGILNVLFPGACLYVILSLISHLSREEMLGKMTELLDTVLKWGIRTLLGAAAGFQIVRNMTAPVIDSLKRGLAGKAASALPGIGNAVNTVTEVLLTSAVLVRNSFGVVILFAFVIAGIIPMVRFVVLSLSYRFLAAVAQPVSDKRIVECLMTMGEGYSLMLKLLSAAEILCMLNYIVVMAGIGGIG